MLDQYSPIVTPHMNFDTLLIPEDHVSRGTNDTYYVNKSHLLRTHTSAHQAQTMSSGVENFLVCGDVYRRDEIDARYEYFKPRPIGWSLSNACYRIVMVFHLLDGSNGLLGGVVIVQWRGCEFSTFLAEAMCCSIA
jgi:hypothetical protein